MAFIRRVRTASGATAVQVAEYWGGRQRIVKHVSSAHTDAELGLLLERARELLEDPGQAVFDLRVEPTPRKTHRVAPPVEPGLLDEPAAVADRPHTAAARVVGTSSRLLFDVLAQLYTSLGFDAAVDDAARTRVLLDQVASLTDASAVTWHARLVRR